ncbi:uncharacterized protein LOC124268433 [Haliotis rubra]|uniref:uncharacterized protein LOC124268433 n=1 Tax=Haliotis rubra TaxID=36100 RepID=UPI001EE503C9|nr:uncharacterized protein LOC124268433 [Haliotis rubra]
MNQVTIFSYRQFVEVPSSKVAFGEGSSLWEVFGGFPDVLVLATFAHGFVHKEHYAQQLIKLGETAESLGERFGIRASTEQSVEDVVAAATERILAGPSMPNIGTIMLIAGALKREVVVHMEDRKISAPPCTCLEYFEGEEVHVYVDRGRRAYYLTTKTGDEKTHIMKEANRFETEDPDRSIFKDENDAETVVMLATTGILLQAKTPQYQSVSVSRTSCVITNLQ